jgi:hypothetical protein
VGLPRTSLGCAQVPINASALPHARSRVKSERRRGVLRASGKAVWTWPSVVAVDAGPMQIQLCEGAVLSRAETVLQGTTRDTVHPEIGYCEKVSQRLRLKKLEEGIDWTTRRSGTGPEGCRVFELERVVSCRSADRWWRTKLNFGSGESFDDLHRSTAFRAAPKTKRVFSGSNVLSSLRLLG